MTPVLQLCHYNVQLFSNAPTSDPNNTDHTITDSPNAIINKIIISVHGTHDVSPLRTPVHAPPSHESPPPTHAYLNTTSPTEVSPYHVSFDHNSPPNISPNHVFGNHITSLLTTTLVTTTHQTKLRFRKLFKVGSL
ncbi:hypothetical protein Bca101_010413 [Brassica carinata]